jgi:hypothetical protein
MIQNSFCDGIDLFHARRATTDPLRVPVAAPMLRFPRAQSSSIKFSQTCWVSAASAAFTPYVSNSPAPMYEPGLAPGGQANTALPTCVVNWFIMSNFESFSLMGIKPARGSP